ncbi:hypothetical protein [Allokutzneria sp. NRRL B-24872]|uniref:hypothetical protein n=1 Tax=Allokutzneria sp. NRRL B-24872 TaxID=1137961 RepID=UPI000A3D1685|nr:hypothetical protein [Allokutzneria sp. NRRL B-24872]
MGVELELHSARPASSNWKKSRTTLVMGSYEHGERLAEVLSWLPWDGTVRLGLVDASGNTVFNEQEAEVALKEVPDLLQRCSAPEQIAAVQDLEQLLRACSRTPGSYLWFMGD